MLDFANLQGVEVEEPYVHSISLQGPGNYTCQASLSGGGISDTQLYAEDSVPTTPTSTTTAEPSPPPSPPSTSIFLSIITSSDSSNLFDCVAAGPDVGHVVSLSWSLNGAQVVTANATGAGLVTLNVPFAGYGLYTCTATLEDDSTIEQSRVHVVLPSPSPSPSPSPPIPSPPPLTVTLISHPSEIVCTISVSLAEILRIFLLRNGLPVPSAPKIYPVLGNRTLAVLNDTSPGNYTCYVVTVRGEEGQASLVLAPPTLFPPPILPPEELAAEWLSVSGDVRVTWQQPSYTEHLLGYKLNWGPPALYV